MSSNELLELHKRHQIGQEKYTYFLLAVTASAVTFAIQKTDGLIITLSLLPLGGAVLLWGLSFYFGIKNLLFVQTALGANYSLLQLDKGVHADQPDHPQVCEVAIRGIKSAIESSVKKAQFYGIWQFRLLITGAALFVLWHILEMILRTSAS